MKLSKVESVLLFLSILGYVCLGYLIDRSQFYYVIILFTLLSVSYLFILRKYLGKESEKKEISIDTWIGIGIFLRLVFLLSIPVFSDDYFRFIWDGSMINIGENPFLILPSEYMTKHGVDSFSMAASLYEGMNSKSYFTVYPPMLQFMDATASFLFPKSILGNVIILRLFIIAAEIGTLLVLKKMLLHFKKSTNFLLIYGLNPLVIMELTGNLHFEAVMIFFLLLALYALLIHRWKISAVFWGVSVATKLIPLLFLPFLLVKLGRTQSIKYYVVVFTTILILFLPFISIELFTNIYSSINLYFQSFEFNASIYYLVRYIGYQIQGYNIIQTAGPVLSFLTFLFVLMVLWYKKQPKWTQGYKQMIFALSIYLSMATTVHPWYLTTLVAFSVFVKNVNFIILWSLLVILSYGVYSGFNNDEKMILIAIEYLLVWAFMIRETFLRTRLGKLNN